MNYCCDGHTVVLFKGYADHVPGGVRYVNMRNPDRTRYIRTIHEGRSNATSRDIERFVAQYGYQS